MGILLPGTVALVWLSLKPEWVLRNFEYARLLNRNLYFIAFSMPISQTGVGISYH